MRPENDDLDSYISETEKKLKHPKPTPAKIPAKQREITTFRKWLSCAGMDLINVGAPLIMLTVTGVVTLAFDPTWAVYIFLITGAVAIAVTPFFIIDFYRFKTWQSKLNFPLHGMNEVMNSRSNEFWTSAGEYWVKTQITFELKSNSTDKHIRAIELFLKKMQKRLNQWTVSEDQQIGYSQPNGWHYGDLTLTGDMNARVLNLIRKRLSGELNRLSGMMPGSINVVSIKCYGNEKHHLVNHDID